jgi:6-pyruvoyltetrahydropterin/6-carboxytetrahydropterin synthase
MITVERRYHFESAHWLPKVPDGHRCKRIHGHNYELLVQVMHSDGVDETGFVIDFADLDVAVHPILSRIDHRCLNDIEGLENPTAELIGEWFVKQLEYRLPKNIRVHTVVVYETKDCSAIVTRQN